MRLSSSFGALASVALLVGCTSTLPKTAAPPVASADRQEISTSPAKVSVDVEVATCAVDDAPAAVADPVLDRAEKAFAKRGASAVVHFFDRDPEDTWELLSINGFQTNDEGVTKIEMVDGWGHGIVFTVPATPGKYLCGRDGVRMDERGGNPDRLGSTEHTGGCEIVLREGEGGRLEGRFKALLDGAEENRTIDVGWFIAERPTGEDVRTASVECVSRATFDGVTTRRSSGPGASGPVALAGDTPG